MGTLVAILIGGIVAALITTVIGEAVRGQRSVADRDEASEFSLFIKNVLLSDASCTSVLNGKAFKPSGKVELELAIGYGHQPDAVVKKGFSTEGLEVSELTLEDRSPKAVQFRIGVDQGNGKVSEVTVRRHLARVKLQFKNRATGALERARYFEFPLLFNVKTERIEMCNNDVNIGDACQALGFRWESSTIPPRCVMANSCLYGGAYTQTSTGACIANPATGACSCPSGPGTNYQPVATGSVNVQRTACVKGCDPFRYDVVYQCFWCPQ